MYSTPDVNGPPDRKRAETAFKELLLAFGLDPEDPNLVETPQRAAAAWADTLLAGYREDPLRTLGRTYPSASNGAVIATRIPLLSMCPHHLLPLTGQAHVAFHPNGKVPGFGRIAKMVDALAHRLVLQEDLTRSIVDALASALDVDSAACVLEARHTCVVVTDPAHRSMCFRTTASHGPADRVASLMQQIDASLRAPWTRSEDPDADQA